MLTREKQLTLELGEIDNMPVAAGVTIFQGAAIGLKDGFARPLQHGDIFVGFAMETSIRERVNLRCRGKLDVRLSHVAPEDVLRAIYMTDDETFTFDGHGNSRVGYVRRYISPDTCVIEFGPQLPPDKKS
jgi:hypothetical protein